MPPMTEPPQSKHSDVPELFELPELTLSLRRFGSGRRSSGSGRAEDLTTAATREAQERFFSPLLAARRAAAAAPGRAAVVVAFDGRRLTALLDAAVRGFASDRLGADPPARRAFEAELAEIVEPFRVALQRLRAIAEESGAERSGNVADDRWRSWVEQLRATFRIADAVWQPLGDALEHAPHASRSVRGWLGRRPRGGR